MKISKFIVLWHADPLLGNNREISNYKTAVARQLLRKKSMFPRQQENTAKME
jgi:3-deoxy-D-arabino-heptulosonate 7-phosphate (DAHP) synthase class II